MSYIQVNISHILQCGTYHSTALQTSDVHVGPLYRRSPFLFWIASLTYQYFNIAYRSPAPLVARTFIGGS